MEKHITTFTDQELISEIAECLSLVGEVKVREKLAREELLKRQIATGETNIEHDGWQSVLKREPITFAWVEREYGYAKEDLPADCLTEKMQIALNTDALAKWLKEEGFDMKPTYGITVARKKGR